MHPAVLVAGAVLVPFGLAQLSGAERLARAIRSFDRSSGLFTTWGTGVYARFAPRLVCPFYKRVASDVLAEVENGSVLDVGTGPGLLALEIARQGPNVSVVGVDIAPLMLERARVNARSMGLERVLFEFGEAARLPFPDSSFDLVLSTLSLHHWSNLEAAFGELHRVLRPGGRLWLYDMCGDSYSVRELSTVIARTPFVGQPVEGIHVQAGRLPVPFYVRFAVRRNEERAHV